MWRYIFWPSLHILSSIGTFCRRQKSYTCRYILSLAQIRLIMMMMNDDMISKIHKIAYLSFFSTLQVILWIMQITWLIMVISVVNLTHTFMDIYIITYKMIQGFCDGTYCRSVHIVVGDICTVTMCTFCRRYIILTND